MRHGLWLNNGTLDPEDVISYGIAAEEAGWDGVFVSDSFAERGYSDPWPLLSGLATRTESVRLGTWVTPLARRQPWQIALTTATVDQISDGRVLLGAGLGLPEDFSMFGLESEDRIRAEQLDEALELVDRLWAGDRVTYQGDHYDLQDVELPVTPVQKPRIPILLAGFWPNKKPIYRGAQWDGIMPAWETEELTESDLRAMLSFFNEHAGESGEVLLPIDMTPVPSNLDDLCDELGVGWTLTTCLESDGYQIDAERIRAGPRL